MADAPSQVEVLFQDDAFVAVAKPPDLSVHSGPGAGSHVLREVKARFGELLPVHRLDKQASGVLLLARNKAALKTAQNVWERARKTYWALVEGAPSEATGVIDAPVLDHRSEKPERVRVAMDWHRKNNPKLELPEPPSPGRSAVHPAGRPTQTEFEVRAQFSAGGKTWSVLHVRPRQGRLHQIRVHLAHAGWPLAVDAFYGTRSELRTRDWGLGDDVLLTRVPLHALKLELPHPMRPEVQLSIEAPLAADLAGLLGSLEAQR